MAKKPPLTELERLKLIAKEGKELVSSYFPAFDPRFEIICHHDRNITEIFYRTMFVTDADNWRDANGIFIQSLGSTFRWKLKIGTVLREFPEWVSIEELMPNLKKFLEEKTRVVRQFT